MALIDDFKPVKPAGVPVPVPVEEPDEVIQNLPVAEPVELPDDDQGADEGVDEPTDDAEQGDVPAEAGDPEPEDDTQASDSPAPTDDEEKQLGDSETVMGDQPPPKAPGKFKRFFQAYWRKKKWTLPVTFLVLIGIIFALPLTRYPILALGISRSYTVAVVDSKTNTPVSGAQITLDGKTATTDSSGDATLKVPVGTRVLTVSKQYYTNASMNVFVGLGTGKNSDSVHLSATGRQVPVVVVNKLTGKPVANAEIKVVDTEAKTDASGKATIVLPTGSATLAATISADGYNDLTGSVSVTSNAVSSNTFQLVPAGRVYFLSNLSGNIDVVSTNLDGSGRKTVLGGTGSEDPNNTSLLASTDWQYLALLSKRDGGQYPKLYLINTSNGQVTTLDGGGSDGINLVGWSGHNFVYRLTNNTAPAWQNGQTVLKSYDADNSKSTTIDQTTADGSQGSYESQTLSFVNLVEDKVVYGMTWNSNYGGSVSASHQNTIVSVNSDGSSKTTVKSISLPSGTWNSVMTAVAPKPGSLDIQTNNGSSSNIYYTYNYGNNSVTQSNTISDNSFGQELQSQVTYLESPSANATFWAEQRDGKYTLFTGDYNGNNSNQIATLSQYTTYGWYTDNYLLVEKGGSELYIMPAAGGTALKVSDYYKPPINYYGYGGGYGGL